MSNLSAEKTCKPDDAPTPFSVKWDDHDLFRAFLDNSPHLFWIIDENNRLVQGNNAFFRFLGIDPAEEKLTGQCLFRFVPDYIISALQPKYEVVLNSGVPRQFEEKLFMADGSEQVFWLNVFPLNNRDGSSLLIGAQAFNVTRELKTVRQLDSANQRLSYFGRITNDAIWEWDMRSGQVYRNEKLYQLIGLYDAERKGLSWWLKRIHPEDRDRVSENISKAAERGLQSWEDEYRFRCADGKYKYIYDRGFIVYENGQPVKMIGSLHDATELKMLKEKLDRERTAVQKKVTETIFKVQEKERSRIAHELHDNINQILTSARLFLNMIEPADAVSSETRRKVDEFILQAIEEIRTLSKEMIIPRLKDDGLVAGISELVEDLRVSCPVKVQFQYEPEVETISVNKKIALFRMLQELVKNALKHSQASSLLIDLAIRSDNVELTVTDDGIGFDISHTRRGIGLTNIYERTRFYNGRVQISSEPGKGCKVMSAIPVKDEEPGSSNTDDSTNNAI